MEPKIRSKWRDVDSGEIITVLSFDGAYAVVLGEYSAVGRGESNTFLVQPTHFGKTYLPVEA